jgi:hypothetical protein
MPSGLVLIAIGDVAGHGPAAAGMARLRGALAGCDHRRGPGPAGQLAERPGPARWP